MFVWQADSSSALARLPQVWTGRVSVCDDRQWHDAQSAGCSHDGAGRPVIVIDQLLSTTNEAFDLVTALNEQSLPEQVASISVERGATHTDSQIDGIGNDPHTP